MNNTVVTQLYKSINIFNRFGMMIRLSGYLYFYFSFPECLWISYNNNAFLTGAESDAAVAKSFCLAFVRCVCLPQPQFCMHIMCTTHFIKAEIAFSAGKFNEELAGHRNWFI